MITKPTNHIFEVGVLVGRAQAAIQAGTLTNQQTPAGAELDRQGRYVLTTDCGGANQTRISDDQGHTILLNIPHIVREPGCCRPEMLGALGFSTQNVVAVTDALDLVDFVTLVRTAEKKRSLKGRSGRRLVEVGFYSMVTICGGDDQLEIRKSGAQDTYWVGDRTSLKTLAANGPQLMTAYTILNS